MFIAWFCLLNTSCPKKCYVQSVALLTKYVMQKRSVMFRVWFCFLNTSCPKKCYIQRVVLLTKYVMPKEVLCSQRGSAY